MLCQSNPVEPRSASRILATYRAGPFSTATVNGIWSSSHLSATVALAGSRSVNS